MRLLTLVVLIGLAAATIVVAYFLVEPAPPKEIRIAAGSKTGAYYPIAQRLAERMRPHGVRVEVLETNGASHNLKLMTGEAPPELALVQGGTHPPKSSNTSQLRTLATVDLEPVWLIAKPGSNLVSLKDLSTQVTAAGKEGSGTLDLFRTLMHSTGRQMSRQTLFASNLRAVDAFVSNRTSVLFSVSPAENPWLMPLIRATEIEFVELSEAEALTRRLPYITTITLPRASLDLARDIPKRDVTLLATATNLVSSEGVYTATKMLALQALREFDHGTLLLDTDGQFPTLKYADYPVDAEARRFFSTGPPFIRRYLPYWIANLVERFYAFFLPLLAIIMPLVRLIPAWIQRHHRETTQRWYDRLAEAEQAIAAAGENDAELQRQARHLDRLERQLEQRRQQFSDLQEYFSLRFHIEQIRRQLWRKLVAGWLETEGGFAALNAKRETTSGTESYRTLLSEIEKDLSLFADLEFRFKQTGIPGEFYSDIVDAKRGLRQARERLLAADANRTEPTTWNDASDSESGAPSRPAITLVSDRSDPTSRQGSSDGAD